MSAASGVSVDAIWGVPVGEGVGDRPSRGRVSTIAELTANSDPTSTSPQESFLSKHKVAIVIVALLAGFVTYAGFKFDIAAHPDVLVAYSLGTLILGGGACYLFKKEKSEKGQEPLTRMQKAGRMLLVLVAIAAVGAAVGSITYFANRDLFWNAVHKVEPVIEGAFVTDAWKVILTGVVMGAIPVAMLASAAHHRKEDSERPAQPRRVDYSAGEGWEL